MDNNEETLTPKMKTFTTSSLPASFGNFHTGRTQVAELLKRQHRVSYLFYPWSTDSVWIFFTAFSSAAKIYPTCHL